MSFFDNQTLTLRREARLRAAPIPETGWRLPENPPDLSDAVVLAVDTETKDPDLIDHGPGWARGRGHIVGVSIAAKGRRGEMGKWYFPVRHEGEGALNLPVDPVMRWLKQTLEYTPHIPKVGANFTYDIGWLKTEGINVSGQLHDVQFAEALLDSEARVSLNRLGLKYLNVGKTTSALEDWQQQAFPHTPDKFRRRDIYRTPTALVGPYAEDDAALPILIIEKQYPLLLQEQLITVYRLECDLIRLMVAMRYEGVTVNMERAVRIIDELTLEINNLYALISNDYGYRLNASDTNNIARLFDHVGIPYPKKTIETKKGEKVNASIDKHFLAALAHPLGEIINGIREHEKLIGTFLQGYILNGAIPIAGQAGCGKLYTQFHQLKGDENGTVVGRFASSTPNLQNIPSRTKLGKKVRECFVYDVGHKCWRKYDASQIHYRLLAHNAVGPGADALRASYINDPKTDYHDYVYNNVAPDMGWSLTDPAERKLFRRPVKNYNFGIMYGQGQESLIRKSGLTGEQAERFMVKYYENAPYVKPTMQAIAAEVQRYGYVTTLLGRRIRFSKFEPLNGKRGIEPLPYREAVLQWGSAIKYAFDYRGINYKMQGSEPDIIKMGMLNCHNSGVFDYTGVPRLTVHDEVDFSVRDKSPQMIEAFEFIRHTMQNAIKLRVPVYVDMSEGPSWGEAD